MVSLLLLVDYGKDMKYENTLEPLDTIRTSKLVLLMELSFVEVLFRFTNVSKWDNKSVPCVLIRGSLYLLLYNYCIINFIG